MGKKVFIIGNGFDIDLGWKTKFSDFANSDYWNIPNKALGEYLNQKKNTDKWFDLEEHLRIFATSHDRCVRISGVDSGPKVDMPIFQMLTKELSEYLLNEESKPIRNGSVALDVLDRVLRNGFFHSIYSFNYTDLNIAAKLCGSNSIAYSHVHGSLANHSAILGIEEESNKIQRGYHFLGKVYNEYYESHPIQYDLQEADEVVIFGHSLGRNDHHFFKDFFQRQSRQDMTRKDSRRIAIFCYDDDSRINILRNVSEMTNDHLALLYEMNDFSIIQTKGITKDNNAWSRFIQHLKDDSLEVERNNLNRLISMI